MPRASWSGFLRLSLVCCPVYLSPATTRTKSLRLHQVWRPAAADEPGPEESDRDRDGQVAAGSRPQPADPRETERADQATRIALRPHDPRTGEEIAKLEVVKGYEYGRGRFVTFTAEELKALDVESSKLINLETFVPHGDIDPVYLDSPYYLYPDGPIAVEALRVIGAAMTEAGVTDDKGELDAEMVAIARAIIRQRTGTFDPSIHRDRYQDALRALIEAKLRGLPIRPRKVIAPPPVIDLMAALKRSLAEDTPAITGTTAKKKRARPAADRRQRSLLLPVTGSRKRKEEPATEPAAVAMKPRRKASRLA